jgi:hypothetical protein
VCIPKRYVPKEKDARNFNQIFEDFSSAVLTTRDNLVMYYENIISLYRIYDSSNTTIADSDALKEESL